MNRAAFVIAQLIVACLFATAVQAHEFIVKPQEWQKYTAGQILPVSVASSHVFMKSEELEATESVEVTYKGTVVPLEANKAYYTYDGQITLDGTGAALIRGHRKGLIWSKTTQGMKPGGRDTLEGVLESRLYEKFCKTLLPVDGKTDGWDVKTGDALEIVPLDNPLTLRPGDELRVQILHEGQPVSPEMVTATYDVFTDQPNAYAYFTEPYGEGMAVVKVSASGLWMVRVQYVVDVAGKDYEKHIMRSVLVFPVAK